MEKKSSDFSEEKSGASSRDDSGREAASGYNQFAKDKRKRIVRVERNPRTSAERPDGTNGQGQQRSPGEESTSSRQDGESRRSYNPNFTSDNRKREFNPRDGQSSRSNSPFLKDRRDSRQTPGGRESAQRGFGSRETEQRSYSNRESGQRDFNRESGQRSYPNREAGQRDYNRDPGKRDFNREPAYGRQAGADKYNRGDGQRDFRKGPAYSDRERDFNRETTGPQRRTEGFGRGDAQRPAGNRGYDRSGSSRGGYDRSGGSDRSQGGFERGNKPYANRPSGYRREGGDYPNRAGGARERDFNRVEPDRVPTRDFNRVDSDRPSRGDFNRESDRGRGYDNRRSGPSQDRRGSYSGAGRAERPGSGEYRQSEFRPRASQSPYGRPQGSAAPRKPIRPKGRPEPRYDSENYPKFPAPKISAEIRLNRYLSMSGVSSRREADELIKSGVVTVNGQVVTELGSKVKPDDKVAYNGKVVTGESKVYIVMNKPKGYVTTIEDPNADQTVMDLLKGAVKERVYPVGRLDKNSLGVLLITNDGDMTKRLTHPSHNKKKIYQVRLDKALTKADMEQIATGVLLDDGEIHADEISYVGESKKDVGIEIHSGRNRIIRRIFEHLGYQVIKLDRVYFAGLTKKKLKRGAWRFLSSYEVNALHSGQYE